MSGISRRDLLCSGLALSASSLVAHSAWGRTAALLCRLSAEPASAEALAAVAPREQLLFDFGWKFQFGHGTDPARDLGFGIGQGDFAKTGDFAFSKAKFDDSKWRALNLPHDWAVELPFVRRSRSRTPTATSPLAAAIPRPAWAGIAASSRFRPATRAAAFRSNSMAPSATCLSL